MNGLKIVDSGNIHFIRETLISKTQCIKICKSKVEE